MVVIFHPYPRLFPYLVYVLEDILVQYTPSVRTVEAFHERVLGRLSRLYVFELYTVHPAPVLRQVGYEFRSVVHPDLLRFSFFVDQMVQYPDNTVAGQREIDLDMERLPVEVVDDVERPETPFVLQYIGHEIDAPGMVDLGGNLQGFFYPCRQTFLYLSSQRQAKGLVYTVYPLMVPRSSLVAQSVIGLPETFFRMFACLLP